MESREEEDEEEEEDVDEERERRERGEPAAIWRKEGTAGVGMDGATSWKVAEMDERSSDGERDD